MKILVALSGGVDSAAAALLLKKQGYTVIGITAKMWHGANAQDIKDAETICQTLGIEHHYVDLCNDFQEKVIAPFVQQYDIGLTPNPCVICNKEIKFGVLAKYLQEFACEKFATGHYARIDKVNNKSVLLKAKDLKRDQSYFLYGLPVNLLDNLLFPLGEYTKDEIRKLVADAGISVAHKSDSQDICFVPNGDYMQVLNEIGLKHSHTGNFKLANGEKIGKHQGLASCTIGQRKGLGISWEHPLYVVKKDTGKNAVILGKNEDLFSDVLTCENLNFLIQCPEKFSCTAKIRYRANPAFCEVQQMGVKCIVKFQEKQRAITPGQSIVFYDNDVVLGGGIIR